MLKQLIKQIVFGSVNTLKSRWQSFRLRGDNVYCPCCEGHYSIFLPYGGRALRPNACCPKCGSVERHRLLWLFLEKKTELFQRNHKMLHIGPQHIYLERFRKVAHIDYTFGDLEPDYFMRGKGARIIDVTQLQFEDSTFDALICNHVLEHVPDDRKAMAELLRVLRPGGWAILQVPIAPQRTETYEDFSITSPEEREKEFGQKDHVRWYGQDYPDRLREAGFEVEIIRYAEQLPPAEIERMRLDREENIYFCHKIG